MNKKEIPSGIVHLSLYYSLVQLIHLTLLTRAGFILWMKGQVPFPALPPLSGWSNQTLPFLLGMGVMDAIAAGLAVVLGIIYLQNKRYLTLFWILSLTSSFTSAVVFTIGTLPSGVWGQFPLAYGLLVIFFAPLVILYIWIIRQWQSNLDQHQ